MITLLNEETGLIAKINPKIAEDGALWVTKRVGREAIKKVECVKGGRYFLKGHYENEKVTKYFIIDSENETTEKKEPAEEQPIALETLAEISGDDFEEIIAEYFDADALHEAPEQLFRVNAAGKRFYYKRDPRRFYASVTTINKQVIPSDESLTKWIADLGYAESKRYMHERADYGTLMHMLFNEFLITGEMDLDGYVRSTLIKYCIKKKREEKIRYWLDDMKQDLIGFAEFVAQHNVKPLAIEIGLTSEKYEYAGAIDLICNMDIDIKDFHGEVYKSANAKKGIKKGDPKKTKQSVNVNAMIDYKSGRNAGFPEHPVQLKLYENMVKENLPSLFDSGLMFKLFNYHPKNWRSFPSWLLQDQTEKTPWELCENYLAVFKKTYDLFNYRRTYYFGTLLKGYSGASNVYDAKIEEVVDLEERKILPWDPTPETKGEEATVIPNQDNAEVPKTEQSELFESSEVENVK